MQTIIPVNTIRFARRPSLRAIERRHTIETWQHEQIDSWRLDPTVNDDHGFLGMVGDSMHCREYMMKVRELAGKACGQVTRNSGTERYRIPTLDKTSVNEASCQKSEPPYEPGRRVIPKEQRGAGR